MKHPKIRTAIIRKDLPGDEEVITSPDGARALIINSTGAAVVDLCDGTRNLEDIACFITDNVPGADRVLVLQDVQRLVEQLEAAGLVED